MSEKHAKVVIIGSGPAGLTASYYLTLQGHDVTVFEALAKAGGLLRYGIPGYRLPDEIVDRDIKVIEATGVKIRTKKKIDSAEALLEKGFEAVFVNRSAVSASRWGRVAVANAAAAVPWSTSRLPISRPTESFIIEEPS